MCVPHRHTFDIAGDEYDSLTEMAAQFVCSQCPLLEQCRAYGLDNAELWGVWGGLTRNDRERISRGETQRQRHIRNPNNVAIQR